MKKSNALVLILVALFVTSCFKDDDDIPVTASELNDFVWEGMNYIYLYKDQIPNLANDRFSSNNDYRTYLNSFPTPKNLFESLKFQPESVDRFSRIFDNYIALEQLFQGNSFVNGMEFSLFPEPNNTTEAYGVIRLVLPNSPAANKNLKRGDIIYGVNGTKLTRDNVNSLFSQDTYTLNLGIFNDQGTLEETDDSIDPLNEDVSLSKVQYNENPVFTSKIINVGGENVGYLMYNGFVQQSENILNPVFGEFKSNNIQHLVLDLRYNSGGSVSTTAFLASMITGQYTGELFEKLIYNSTLQSRNTDYNFANKLNNGATINSLGLNKLYVLTSVRSASASEGLINGLVPYMDEVIQIGTNTTGKTQASTIVYDSGPPNFLRQGANPNHTYAMLPLIANGVNKNNETVPGSGLPPSIGFEYIENQLNYGILGDAEEPMLALALAAIENSTSKVSDIKSKSSHPSKVLMDSDDLNPFEGGMIAD